MAESLWCWFGATILDEVHDAQRAPEGSWSNVVNGKIANECPWRMLMSDMLTATMKQPASLPAAIGLNCLSVREGRFGSRQALPWGG